VRAGSLGVVRAGDGRRAAGAWAPRARGAAAGHAGPVDDRAEHQGRGGFGRTLRSALERAGVVRPRVALVLPDPVARGRRSFPRPRWRRRSATRSTSWCASRSASRSRSTCGRRASRRCLGLEPAATRRSVAAMHRPVLEGYEAACRAQDLTPGIVELTGPGLLTAAFGALPRADRLLVNWDEGYLTLMLARGRVAAPGPDDHGPARVLADRGRAGGGEHGALLPRPPERQRPRGRRDPLGLAARRRRRWRCSRDRSVRRRRCSTAWLALRGRGRRLGRRGPGARGRRVLRAGEPRVRTLNLASRRSGTSGCPTCCRWPLSGPPRGERLAPVVRARRAARPHLETSSRS
jgi:hypothetical protein